MFDTTIELILCEAWEREPGIWDRITADEPSPSNGRSILDRYLADPHQSEVPEAIFPYQIALTSVTRAALGVSE